MADDLTLNAGTGGATLATDEDAGANRHYQIVKLADGTADSETRVAAGGGVEANALRVTIANDSTGLVSVDDNGGSLTVDSGAAFTVQEDGAALTALQLLDDIVATDDTSTHATGTTKGAVIFAAATPTDGSVAANDLGAVAMSTDRRLHTDTQIVGQDADITIADGGNSLTVDNGGTFAVQATLDAETTKVIGTVNVAAAQTIATTNAGTFVVQEDGAALTALQLLDDAVFADDAAFTLASSKVTMAGAIRDDTLSTLTAVEGDAVPLRVGSTGALHVTGGGGGTEYTEDEVTANPIIGTATLMERDDALTTVTPLEGDWIGLRGSAEGALWVQDFNSDAILADTANMDTNLGTIAGAVSGTEMQVDVATITGVTMSNAGMQITGDEAHDAADAGNPVKTGGKAKAFDGTAPGTDVAENDRVDHIATVDGRQYVETTHPNYWSASADYASAQTNATVKAAPGASLKLYITDVIVSNGATAGNITLLDGSGGSVLLELYPAINGGLTHAFRTPIALTANTLLAITSTTVTTHSVTVSGFIAA